MADKLDQPIFSNVPSGTGQPTHVYATDSDPSGSGRSVRSWTVSGMAARVSTELDLGSAAQADTGDFASASHEHAGEEITSGTIPSARMPLPTATGLGGVTANSGAAGEFVSGINPATGALTYSTPAGAGSGSVTSVAVAGTDGIQVDSGSPITGSGTIQLGVDAAALRTHINVENGATADQSAAEILAALLTVDGAGSALDADLLDGQSSAAFAAASHTHAAADTTSGTFAAARIPVAGAATIGGVMRTPGASGEYITGFDVNGVPEYDTPAGAGTVTSVAVSGTDGIQVDSGSPITGTGTIQLGVDAAALRTHINVENGATADQSAAEILAALLTVDGAGSALDADLLDGQSSAAFATASHTHNASDINAGTLAAARLPTPGTTTLGGVMRNDGGGQFVRGIDTDGSLLYGIPEIGGTITATIETFADLEDLVDDAIADPDNIYKGLVVTGIDMADNISKFNLGGTDKSFPANAILEFARLGYLDFGRNVWQITEAEVTNSGGNMLFTITGHGMATDDVVFFRSNAPLPQITTDHLDRIERDVAYNVIVNNADSFFIATIEAPTVEIAFNSVNACDIWVFRGFQAAGVDTVTDFITANNHGLSNGMRIRFLIEDGETWTGGAAEATRYFVRDAEANRFKIQSTIGGGAVNFSGTPSRGVMFVAAFEINILGRIVSDTPCFQNYTTGLEALPAKSAPSIGSVFGRFLGNRRRSVWWGVIPEEWRAATALNNGFGFDGAANVRFRDQTEAVQAAVNSRYRIIGGTGKGANTDVNTYYTEEWGNSWIEFETGLIRITDRIRFYSDTSTSIIGAGSRSTQFLVDTYEGNPGLDGYADDNSNFTHAGFQIENGNTFSLRFQAFGMHGTTRIPPNHAMFHISDGNGADDMIFRDLYISRFGRAAFAIEPRGLNHPLFQGVSVQHCMHPRGSVVKSFSSEGGVRFVWDGGTLNQGESPYFFRSVFECRSATDATIRNVHFEHTVVGVYFHTTDVQSRLTIDNCDNFTGSAKDVLAVPTGSGNFVDVYPVGNTKFTISSPNFGVANQITFTLSSSHELVEDEMVGIWNTDGVVDGSAADISGLYRLLSVTDTTITIPISGTGSGSLSETAWVATAQIASDRWPHEGDCLIFQTGGPGEDLTFSGLALDTPYYLNGATNKGFNWSHMTDDGGDLEIDFGSAHGITDGSPVYWLPTLSPTSTNVHMPTGILYNKGPYFCDSTGTNTLKLCNDQAITDPIAFPSDFSRLTATGLTGGANNKLGSECYYFALSARFRLSSSRDGAEEDADIQTVTAQAARLMTRVCSLVSVGEGRVNVTMSSCRIENDGRPSPHGTVRAPITMIDNNGAEMLPTDWADPADATIYSCGMASLEGTAGNQIDLITTR